MIWMSTVSRLKARSSDFFCSWFYVYIEIKEVDLYSILASDSEFDFVIFRLCGNNESSSSIPLLSTSWTSLEQQQQAWRRRLA